MAAASVPSARPGNDLLASLPEAAFRRLRSHLTTISLSPKRVLQKQGSPLEHVYFPEAGIVSIATLMSDGSLVEAANVGPEGLVGIDAFLRAGVVSPCEAIVQVGTPGGTAQMMSASAFRAELSGEGALYGAVSRYAQVLYAQLARLTACNTRHDVSQRCARWLLTTSNQMHGRDFHLSQEFLAVMLGVRRQAVSGVAGAFQSAGLIRYRHGDIRILNRPGLEAASCECYRAITDLHMSLRG